MRTLALTLALAFAGPLVAADADFKAIVHGMESEFGIRQMHIPFFGLASFFIKVGQPAGVHQLDLAIFEDAHFAAPDQEAFDSLVRSSVGDRWRPLIRVRSRHDRESSYIYVRENGNRFRLLIANFERDEATVLQLEVSARRFVEMCSNPDRIGKLRDH